MRGSDWMFMEPQPRGKATVHEVGVKPVEARYMNEVKSFPTSSSAPGIV